MPGGRLVLKPSRGLCNRLQTISSFDLLARRTGRELEVCWAGSQGWSDEDLNDLFENVFPRVSEPDFNTLSEQGLAIHEVLTVAGIGGRNQTWTWLSGTRFEDVFDASTYPVVTFDGFARVDELLPPERRKRVLPNFADEYTANLRTWRPVASIRSVVDSITSSFDSRTVGVHVRRGDAWNHPVLAGEYRRSPDDAFFSRMDRLLAADPGTTFFLATDSGETEERFRSRYGSAMFTNADKRFVPSLPGEPKENQRDAVIDLFALARTRLILGSHYSTFSRMAAAIGGARLQVSRSDPPGAFLRRATEKGWSLMSRHVPVSLGRRSKTSS